MPWAGSTRLPALAPPLPTGRCGVPWEGRGSRGCVLSEGRGCPGVPEGLKEPHTPVSNSAIHLAHNLRKRAELLTSGAPCPDPESTLKRRPSPGLPSQAVNGRRHIH